MIIYGYHPVREALRREPRAVERVLLVPTKIDQRRGEIEELCRKLDVTVEHRSQSELDDLASGSHNGFAAELRASRSRAETSGDPDLVVLVEDVTDPRNLGALLRVCEGAGVGRILLRDRGTAPVSPTVVRTSAGAADWLNIERITNTAQTLETLQEEEFWTYGADAAGVPPWEIDLRGKLVICIGGEEKGLRSRTRKVCDGLIGLPMRGRVESLNLSTAAAAILFEAVRQRETGKK